MSVPCSKSQRQWLDLRVPIGWLVKPFHPKLVVDHATQASPALETRLERCVGRELGEAVVVLVTLGVTITRGAFLDGWPGWLGCGQGSQGEQRKNAAGGNRGRLFQVSESQANSVQSGR